MDVYGGGKVKSICNFTNTFKDFIESIILRAKFVVLMMVKGLLFLKLEMKKYQIPNIEGAIRAVAVC